MRDQSGWLDGQGAARADARQRPRYSVTEVARLLNRERLLMLVVFAVVLLAGVIFAATLPKTYTAHSSLLVNLSQQYVYEPVTGDAGRGIAPQKDQVVQSEAEILGSDTLKRRVIDTLGLKVIDPETRRALERRRRGRPPQARGRGVEGIQARPDRLHHARLQRRAPRLQAPRS